MSIRKTRKRIVWSQVLTHPSDRAAAQGDTLRRQRENAWTDNVCEDKARVYQALAEGHGTVSRAGETGYSHGVTGPSLPAIAWDRVTQRWVYASALFEVTQRGNVKRVAHEVRQRRGNNLHKGGSAN